VKLHLIVFKAGFKSSLCFVYITWCVVINETQIQRPTIKQGRHYWTTWRYQCVEMCGL